MNIVRAFVLAILALVSTLSAFAEQNVVLQLGVMTEAGSGHLNCVAYRNNGQPPVFVVRSNRPDLLFDQLDSVKECLKKVKQQIDSPEKYKRTIVPNFTPMAVPSLQLSGEYRNIFCASQTNESGLTIMLEFLFPYLYENEIDSLIHETPLRGCLNTVKPSRTLGWEKTS